jgi:peptide/nickel transport system substrate-binding protein
VKQASLNYNWIGMNITHPNLKDVNVRNAVMWGIDVPSIIQAVYDGLTEQATAMIAPGMPIGYWKDAPTYERDVDKAKGFLEQAGKVGQELVMSASNAEPGAATLAQIVQQNLNEVGFKVTVNIQDGAVFDSATKAANQKKQLFYTGFTTLPDPEWVTTWFTCSQVNVWNYMSWCNDEYSSLDKKGATTVDPDERNTMYIRMQQLMDEAKCALWVTWPTVYFAVKKGITPAVDPGAFFQAHGFQTA